jgi:hypothetical protein
MHPVVCFTNTIPIVKKRSGSEELALLHCTTVSFMLTVPNRRSPFAAVKRAKNQLTKTIKKDHDSF